MLIPKLDPGSQNTLQDTASYQEGINIKKCENVEKLCDLQWRLANCFNKDFGSNSWSFSGRKFHFRTPFSPHEQEQEHGRTGVITTRKHSSARQHGDTRTFCLDAKLAVEKFCVDKLWTSLQAPCPVVIDQSCQRLQPKYLSTSSPLRSH